MSPAFAEIDRILERIAPLWSAHGCTALGVCDDIAGGWFSWAVRDALQHAGKYDSLVVARSWYERVAQEVDAACRTGALECTSTPGGVMPPWNDQYMRPLASSFLNGLVLVATFHGIIPIQRGLRRITSMRADTRGSHTSEFLAIALFDGSARERRRAPRRGCDRSRLEERASRQGLRRPSPPHLADSEFQ